MRFSELLAATAVVAPLVAAHGDHLPGMPKIFGLGAGAKARDFPGFATARRADHSKRHMMEKRQTGGVDGQCGPSAGGASCADGYCCSPSGWCGNTEEYCAAPDCLIDYGSGCDGNKVPNGESTKNVARPKLGNVEYGGDGIYPCVNPGDIALTFDDGPYIYTDGVLDLFKSYNMKATFFITGNNNAKGAIDDASTPWPAVIQRMVAEGHQVASHTWSHQDLSAITKQQRQDQMVHNEMAIRNIIQKFPTYMRPPYSSCTAASGCEADLANLGYHVVYFDLDTTDYLNETPDLIQNAKNVFNKAVGSSNPSTDKFLVIGHDIHQQTAQNLTGYMLQMIQDKGYRGVTVGECLGDPESNWYRASSGKTVTSSSGSPSASKTSSAAPTATPTAVSTDGTCGGSTGFTCIGFSEGSCCSPAGWCGATTDYCGTGCQSLFGTCGSSSSAPASSAVTSAAPIATPSNLVTSPDATCGGTTGYTCIGSPEGECCSQSGYCGTTTDYCGTGCNPLFGNCGGASSSAAAPSSQAPASSSVSSVVVPSKEATTSVAPVPTTVVTKPAPAPGPTKAPAPGPGPAPAPAPAPAPPPKPAGPAVSTNGRCGARNGGTTCKGYKAGWIAEECCRMDGRCGAGVLSCGVGCQKGFGNCWW